MLGSLAWVYLATEITVYSAEVNVVLGSGGCGRGPSAIPTVRHKHQHRQLLFKYVSNVTLNFTGPCGGRPALRC